MSDALRSRLAAEIRPGDVLPPLSHDVTATTVILGALATRDWRPMHHDRDFAIHHSGVKDIFINTPNNTAWFERYITDWTGPGGRLGRLRFKMKRSIFPGDRMTFNGRVTSVGADGTGCYWVELDLTVAVADQVCTECRARVAVPADAEDNPWRRRGGQWRP